MTGSLAWRIVLFGLGAAALLCFYIVVAVRRSTCAPDTGAKERDATFLTRIPSSVALLLVATALFTAPWQAATTSRGFTDTAFAIADFDRDGELLTMLGTRTLNGGLVLDVPRSFTSTSTWTRRRFPISPGFFTRFRFCITDRGSANKEGPIGGDGFAFVMQNSGPQAAGGKGVGLGYAEVGREEASIPHPGIRSAVAIEFDTYKNADRLDPNANHIAIQISNGRSLTSRHDALSSLGTSDISPINLSDGKVHAAEIEYSKPVLQISIDGRVVMIKHCDLASLTDSRDGMAFIGFTGGTGAAYQRLVVLDWSFSNSLSGASDR